PSSPNGGRSICSSTSSRRFIGWSVSGTPARGPRCFAVRVPRPRRSSSPTRRLAACAPSRAGSSEASRVTTGSTSRSRRPPVCTVALRPARSPSACREAPPLSAVRAAGFAGAPQVRSVHPRVVEALRRLDALLRARDVLLLELLEVRDAGHHVVALRRMADLRLLEPPLRLLLVAHQLLHRVPHRVGRRVGGEERDEDE